MQLSVVVPFHRNSEQLRQCLAALRAAGRSLPRGTNLEIIVVADGARENPDDLVASHEARLVSVDGPRGPAVARNLGSAVASGDILVFVDSDVVVAEHALARLAALFASRPDVAAVFGAYDEHPADPGFMSQSKNLAHSFIHQRSKGDAHTFWAGLGAVRAPAFARVGGFDERFARPSVEDIDLGYRLRAAGARIVLEPGIQGRHLKRWTLGSAIVSDVRDRGIPWTQLLHRYDALRSDLNVTVAYRACVVIAYALIACLVAALWRPFLLVPVAAALMALWFLDRPYYRFFTSRRGLMQTLAWFPFHVLHHLSNGLTFAAGTVLYAAQRWAGISFPWTLPLNPWPGAAGRSALESGRVEHLGRQPPLVS